MAVLNFRFPGTIGSLWGGLGTGTPERASVLFEASENSICMFQSGNSHRRSGTQTELCFFFSVSTASAIARVRVASSIHTLASWKVRPAKPAQIKFSSRILSSSCGSRPESGTPRWQCCAFLRGSDVISKSRFQITAAFSAKAFSRRDPALEQERFL